MAGGRGVDNPTLMPAIEAAFWNQNRRFKRIGEGGGGAVGHGGFGEVFQGFDELKQELVFIKRQKRETPQAASEMASYNMLEAFRHPNIIRMCGMWTGSFEARTYLYIAMEACCTTLWKYIRVGNPRPHWEFKRCGGQHKVLLDIVRAVGHLHAHGVTHGDVSLSNILLTAEGVVRLADFGTVTSHTLLTQDKLCVAYIRPPEALLGSNQKGPPVDAWAVAICALALYTGSVPTSSHDLEGNCNSKDDWVFTAVARLLPPITNESFPDHQTLPRWYRLQDQLRYLKVHGTLAQYVAERHIPPPEECSSPLTVKLVEMGLDWNPQCRRSMQEMDTVLCKRFDIQVPQGCQPEQCHRGQGGQPEEDSPGARTAPVTGKQSAGTRSEGANNQLETVNLEPKFMCACSGNCGLQPCTFRLNRKRHHDVAHICENRVRDKYGFCRSCQCEQESCAKQRQKQTKRWCASCARELSKSDFATAQGGRQFDEDDSVVWKVVLRLNHLYPHLDPDDNVAFQEACREFNEPKAGSLMDPLGIVILVIAHALKWPPVVRHFRSTLRDFIGRPSFVRASASIHLVDAIYDAVQWADGKRLTAMHAALSVAGRCHALTGVAVAAGQLGIVSSIEPVGGEHAAISLGPAGKAYYLKPRAELAVCERVVQEYIQHATRAQLCWPDRGTSYEEFASKVSLLMVACHSVRIEGVGLTGGPAAVRDMKSRSSTPRVGCQPQHSRGGKTVSPPYVVPHITRHFMIAADQLGVFDYGAVSYSDIEEHVPDVTNQAGKVANLTLARIKEKYGLDPFFISCHLCFASQFTEEDLRAVLDLPYASLYEPIGKWIYSAFASGPPQDLYPPTLHSLLTALKPKSQSATIVKGEPGLEERAKPPKSKKPESQTATIADGEPGLGEQAKAPKSTKPKSQSATIADGETGLGERAKAAKSKKGGCQPMGCAKKQRK